MHDAEIVREVQVDDKVLHVHIHLSEDEIRRLLLPLVTDAFAHEVRKNGYRLSITNNTSCTMPPTTLFSLF